MGAGVILFIFGCVLPRLEGAFEAGLTKLSGNIRGLEIRETVVEQITPQATASGASPDEIERAVDEVLPDSMVITLKHGVPGANQHQEELGIDLTAATQRFAGTVASGILTDHRWQSTAGTAIRPPGGVPVAPLAQGFTFSKGEQKPCRSCAAPAVVVNPPVPCSRCGDPVPHAAP